MNISIRDALITAASYADIFDYPLTAVELQTWIPFIHNPARHSLAVLQESVLRNHPSINGATYYSLRPTKRLIALRNTRGAWSKDKWTRARWIARLLTLIPTIKLIGITGGLTRSNAKAEDDIDFLIISSSKTLWITRAVTTILLDIFRLRRHPKDRSVQDLVCLNMFMSEDGLALPEGEQDLFTAHEVLLMTPLWERDGTYKKFVSANRWVRKFLPSAWKNRNQELGIRNYEKRQNKIDSFFLFILHTSYFILRLIEPLARVMQLRHMNRRRTTEVVGDTVIRFHPHDARIWIKKKLGVRLTRFNIPLDKIFYAR